MNDQIARARKALKRIVARVDDEKYTYGTVGRLVDGVPTFDVTGRSGYIYVTIRQANGAQTSVPARNDAGVPKALGLPVRMRLEGRTYVVDGIARRDDLAYTNPAQQGNIHTHDNRYFTETEITGAADLGAPSDTDKLLTIRAGGLGSILWSSLKTALNALYARLATANTFTQNQTIASTQTTGNALNVTRNLTSTSTDAPVVSIVEDHTGDDQTALRIQQDGTGAIVEAYDDSTIVLRVNDGGRLDVADVIRALTASGIHLQADGGEAGLHVGDSGTVGIGQDAAASIALDILNGANTAIRTRGSSSSALQFQRSSGNSGGGNVVLLKSRGSVGSESIVSTSDFISSLLFGGYDGAAFQQSAFIAGQVDAAPSSCVIPIGIQIATGTASGSRTVAIMVDSDQNVAVHSSKAPAGVRFYVVQPTLGGVVTRLQTPATNDDPTQDFLQGRIATTNNTVTTLFTMAIPASHACLLEVYVVARRTGGAAGTAEDCAAYLIRGLFNQVAGAANIVAQATTVIGESQAAWDAVFDVSGTDARIRVTGATNNNISWHAHVFHRYLST